MVLEVGMEEGVKLVLLTGLNPALTMSNFVICIVFNYLGMFLINTFISVWSQKLLRTNTTVDNNIYPDKSMRILQCHIDALRIHCSRLYFETPEDSYKIAPMLIRRHIRLRPRPHEVMVHLWALELALQVSGQPL
ncbi:hypothetical protein AVEN_203807-1 [Araneus ventricosus]|uniref:Uncharacterized protein n=1 Tax=Araneus ventricosus TaxID=182803 RepID=A0A4Y2R5M6_ARAVE|nr:hypothetical protein AVEN_203807-1 [Araneus ventricosus]